jgi:hypothetical protein
VGLFRRKEPFHERLAREGGLRGELPPEAAPPGGAEGDPVSWPGGVGSAGAASSRGWMEAGIHGVHRPRTWDTVVTVEVEGVEGDEVHFVALPDDTLLVDEDVDADPLAAALDGVADPPYRAEAVRRGQTRWAIGIRRIEVVDLGDDAPDGEELTLTARDGDRELLVDGSPTFGSIPALEQLGAGRAANYVVQGRRLVDTLWEVQVAPL